MQRGDNTCLSPGATSPAVPITCWRCWAADSLRCADYATFGTQALSDNALVAMKDRRACLLANHGMIAAGKDLAEAFRNTIEVENLSELYLRALRRRQRRTPEDGQCRQDRDHSHVPSSANAAQL